MQNKKEKADSEQVTNAVLKSMCENVMNLITTTVVDMESVSILTAIR